MQYINDVPMARQGGVNARTGDYLGDRSLRPSPMDQNVNEAIDNGLQSRRHMVSSWKPDEDGSPSTVENIAIGDLFYSSTDVSLPTFRKIRGGATHIADLTPFSEDEDVTQDGSPLSHSRRRKHDSYSVAHLNVSTNTSDATPDEISTHSEDYSFYRMKLLCSYAGKILPRPTDNQLRYVGGDTRLITVSRDIHYDELLQKMAELYAEAHTIKYKLPEEDLDALVSVSSNEDVTNMMEEFDRLQSSEASPRLRLFLFSDVDHESVHLSECLGDQRSTEQRYVDAVNGISDSGSRKHSGDGGSVAVAPIIIDSLTDVGNSWGFNLHQDTVPVAMLAPQISQDVASLIQHIPVALPVSSILPMSAPSSAPSSPPLSRVLKQDFIPEMRLSDLHPQTYGHQYNIAEADGVVLEGDDFGVNLVISANVHDHLYNNSDLQREPESPKKVQHEIDFLGGHQEVVARDDVRRLPEVRMPPVPSHGMLTRLSEANPSPRQRQSYQRPQQPQEQGRWPPHSFDDHTHIYSRRMELTQPASDVVAQPIAPGQQPEPPHFRGSFQDVMLTPTIDQPICRPVDHRSLGEEFFAPFMQRSLAANTASPVGTTAGSSYSVGAGSAPSSPRMTVRDLSNMRSTELPQLQLQQVLRAYAAPNYADHQQHGVRHHPLSDGTTRLRPVTSPPRYRDHLGQTDDRVPRPLHQAVVGNADIARQELFLYDGHDSAHHKHVEGIPRGQVPQYQGHNPFQDGFSGFSESNYSAIQGVGDVRRPRERSARQSIHSSHLNAREDLQDGNTLSAEPRLVHSRCQEKPTDWNAHQGDRVFDEIRSWPGGSGADLETLDEAFLHLPEDSDGIIAMSVSYLHTNAGVAEPLSAMHQLPRSIVTQSHVLPVFPSTFAQAVVDTARFPLQVGRDNESGLFDEPVPRSIGNLPAFASSPAFAEVIHLPSESPTNKLASEKDMDYRAETGALNDLVPHLCSTASKGLGNTEAAHNSELRWAGLNDVDELRVDTRALHGSANQDNFLRLSESGSPQSGQSEYSRGIRVEATEEVAVGLQTGLQIAVNDGSLKEMKSNSLDDDIHNLILTDGIPPPSSQLFVRIDQTHILPPTGVTTGVMSFTIPNLSIMTSTEISSQLIPSASNMSACLDTSSVEQEVNSVNSLLFKSGSLALQASEGDVCELLGQNSEFQRKDDDLFTSQFSATGHLAEDIASSALVSFAREMVATLPSANLQVNRKDNKWLPVSRDNTAVVSANLAHAPTFSSSNWDRVQKVTVVDVEVDDDHTGTPDVSVENGDITTSPLTIAEEELAAMTLTEDGVADAAVRTCEDLRQGPSSTGTAEDAEAEAIRSGLQTILNADLEEMRELGSGTFGTVYHGKWRGTDVAIKRIKASCFAGRPAERDRLIADFWREACTLSQLHHPNVVAFYGVVRDGPGGTLATVTEYMVNGSLKQVLQKKDRTIDRRKRLLIAMDAAFGMEYLHSKNIVHFDLKCDNLLVNMRDPHRPICKVGDLGLSKVKHQTMVSGGVRGTLPWMAPELLNGSSTLVTEKVDTFSFGIVMWELLTGEEPYANMHYGAIIGGIVNNTLRPSIPTWCDPLWKSLMERCWSAEPAFRPSFSEVASELRVMATAQPKAHG